MLACILGSSCVAGKDTDTVAFEPGLEKTIVGSDVYPEPPFVIVTECTGPVVSNEAVNVPVYTAGLVIDRAGAEVYPEPWLVTVIVPKDLVAAFKVRLINALVCPDTKTLLCASVIVGELPVYPLP